MPEQRAPEQERQRRASGVGALRAAVDGSEDGSTQLADDPSLIVVDISTWTTLKLQAERGEQLYFESLLTHGVRDGWLDRDELPTWKALHRSDPEGVVASLEAMEKAELLE